MTTRKAPKAPTSKSLHDSPAVGYWPLPTAVRITGKGGHSIVTITMPGREDEPFTLGGKRAQLPLAVFLDTPEGLKYDGLRSKAPASVRGYAAVVVPVTDESNVTAITEAPSHTPAKKATLSEATKAKAAERKAAPGKGSDAVKLAAVAAIIAKGGKSKELLAERRQLILAMHASGMKVREIAEAGGLTYLSVYGVIESAGVQITGKPNAAAARKAGAKAGSAK